MLEWAQGIAIANLDNAKAFDSVDRRKLVSALTQKFHPRGIAALLRVLQSETHWIPLEAMGHREPLAICMGG